MATHLAAQRRPRGTHARLDQRMSGLAHLRHTTRGLDHVGDVPAAFDVIQNRRARMTRQHVLRKQHQLPVGINNVSIFRDHAKPVAVTVKGQTDFGIGLFQRRDEILQIFRMRRVGMMVGKMSIDVTK